MGQASIHRVDHMNNDILEQHPCKNKCLNFTDEHCCHEVKVCFSSSQFKVGDYVVAKDKYTTNELFQIERKGSFGGMYDTKWRLLDLRQFRHATDAEIKTGHRIDFNLNDTISNALDDCGNDRNIENHVSPQCVIGGDK